MIATFSARTVSGRGRGKDLGIPTYNIDLQDVPKGLPEGIFAGSAEIEGKRYIAAIHYGPRPVFKDTTAFEVHLLDNAPERTPEKLVISLHERLRDVQDFPSAEEMLVQISQDIAATRAIMGAHEDIA